MAGCISRDSRYSHITAQQVGIGQGKPREDGRGAKGRTRLPATLEAVTDVEGQRLGDGCLEGDGSALALGVHFDFFALLRFGLVTFSFFASLRNGLYQVGDIRPAYPRWKTQVVMSGLASFEKLCQLNERSRAWMRDDILQGRPPATMPAHSPSPDRPRRHGAHQIGRAHV